MMMMMMMMMMTANFPFSSECEYASVNTMHLSLNQVFNLQKHGISIIFHTGDSRSKSHAQKPANLSASFYAIPHSRSQPVRFQFTRHLKILGASIFLLWLYSVANKKLKCSNAVLLLRVRVCVCVCRGKSPNMGRFFLTAIKLRKM